MTLLASELESFSVFGQSATVLVRIISCLTVLLGCSSMSGLLCGCEAHEKNI